MEQTTVPNQQIVIQFSDTTVTVEDTENAIEAIQNKLESIGVSNIRIDETEKGQFKITYHSDADVSHIQMALFKSENFRITYEDSDRSSDIPSQNKSVKDYELNISEIKTNSNFNWGFDGVQITEINQKTDHSNPTKVYYSGAHINTNHNTIISVAVLANNAVAIAIDNRSYNIPEVRAGPTL